MRAIWASGALIPPTTTSSSSSVRLPRTSQTYIGSDGGGRDAGEDLADPRVLVPHGLAVRETHRRHRPVALDDAPELVPVGLGPDPFALLFVISQLGVGDGYPDVPELRDVRREELLAEVLVGTRLN